jgi:hypothetical protein
MRHEALPPGRLLRALELFGPQARPYNFDDHFDCWGLVKQVFDWLDGGLDMDKEALDETEAGIWQEIGRRDDLVPGDLLATHPRPDPQYHVAFYCGRAGGHDLVYDSSSRGLVPLFDERGTVVDDRAIHTRFARCRSDRPSAGRRRGVSALVARAHALLPQGRARAAAGRRRG